MIATQFHTPGNAASGEAAAVPPARAFPFDLSQTDATLTRRVAITAFDAYDLILAFGDVGASEADGGLQPDAKRDQTWRQSLGVYADGRWTGPLGRLIGGNARKYTFKKTGEPFVVRQAADVAARADLIRRGELVPIAAEPGAEIRIALRVERLDGQARETILDNAIATAGDDGARMNFKQRFLARALKLRPGVYEINAKALDPVSIPEGVGVYIAIALRDPKIAPPTP